MLKFNSTPVIVDVMYIMYKLISKLKNKEK